MKGADVETIASIRELESSIIQDKKNINNLVKLTTYVKSSRSAVSIAAIHSLRRAFTHIFESTLIKSPKTVDGSQLSSKIKEIRAWVVAQYWTSVSAMCGVMSNGDVEVQTVSIRTIFSFVNREYLLAESHHNTQYFGAKTFNKLLCAVAGAGAVDIDVLLMMRNEILVHPDCTFYTLMWLRDELQQLKSNPENFGDSESRAQNILDLLRIISVNESDELLDEDCLARASGADDAEFGCNDEDSDDSDDDGDNADSEAQVGVKGKKRVIKRTDLMSTKFGKTNVSDDAGRKKRKKLSRREQILDYKSHRKLFSRIWLLYLSIPTITAAQHKLILKHLPENVLPNLEKPFLLADYLTRSYGLGGVTAVLALESLFQLIVKFNFDYPKFFDSLYALCTPAVFAAKYRSKFMKLLAMSLKSTNLPVYVVAAFAKRLALLALYTPSPCALFCAAQITMLLKDHPQCMSLLHREGNKPIPEMEMGDQTRATANAKSGTDGQASKGAASALAWPEFDDSESWSVEKAGKLALNSSLWELLVLVNHHLPEANTIATALKSAASTAPASSLVVTDFVGVDYADMIEGELTKTKKGAPLQYKQPTSIFAQAGDSTNDGNDGNHGSDGSDGRIGRESIVAKCFGGFCEAT